MGPREYVRRHLTGGRWRHAALIAETAADARDVMVDDGKMLSDPTAGSGILQVHSADFRADLRAEQAAPDEIKFELRRGEDPGQTTEQSGILTWSSAARQY
jgi:hypothetical protein